MITMLRFLLWSLQYSYHLIPISLPIFWIDWSICTILSTISTINIVSILISVATFCESTTTQVCITIMTRCENYLTFEKYIQERLPSKKKARHKGCSNIYDPYHRKRPPKARNKRVSGTRLKLGNSVQMRPKNEDYIVRDSESTKDYLIYHQQNKRKLRSRYRPRQICFDTDSFRMGVDNHSTVCVYNNPDHFI